MNSKNEPLVFFYVPKNELFEKLPNSPEELWRKFTCKRGKEKAYGKFDWTYQTYLYLKKELSIRLIHEIPQEGIVISHHDFLCDLNEFGCNILLINIQADKKALPMADLHIVQNPLSENTTSKFIHHWPQIDLIPRAISRNEVLNIGYFGEESNFATELLSNSFSMRLSQMGMKFVMKSDPLQWCDYSDVDIALAIRSS